jgi:hypothetical protein
MTLMQAGYARDRESHAAGVGAAPRPAKTPLVVGPTLRIVIVSLGLLLALQLGAMLADYSHAERPWQVLACLTGPIGLAAAAFWVIGRRL